MNLHLIVIINTLFSIIYVPCVIESIVWNHIISCEL